MPPINLNGYYCTERKYVSTVKFVNSMLCPYLSSYDRTDVLLAHRRRSLLTLRREQYMAAFMILRFGRKWSQRQAKTRTINHWGFTAFVQLNLSIKRLVEIKVKFKIWTIHSSLPSHFRTHGIPLNSVSNSLSYDIVRFTIEVGVEMYVQKRDTKHTRASCRSGRLAVAIFDNLDLHAQRHQHTRAVLAE